MGRSGEAKGTEAERSESTEDLGGEPVCWMHLVCEECGAVTTEGHREGCSLAGAGADGTIRSS